MKFLPVVVLLLLSACMSSSNSRQSAQSSTASVYALRLHPGDDLKQRLSDIAKEHNLSAGFVITCVGSVQKAVLRLANQPTPATFNSKYEIVSLTGTLAQDGVHLHIALSDSTGATIGGHLMEGTLIYTTAEIVIGNADALSFSREQDTQSGWKELVIRKR